MTGGRLTREETERRHLAEMAQKLSDLHDIWKPHPKQLAAIRDIFDKGKTHHFWRKGRKGGGTEASLYPVVRLCALFDNQIGYLVYPTHVLGKEIAWKRLQSFIPKHWGVKFREGDTCAQFPNGSTIKIMGADNWKAMVGVEFDICVMDELKDHDPRAYENMYPNRMSRNGIWVILGAPPYNKSNFYYQKEQEALGNLDLWAVHKWSIRDNPFLPYDKAMFASREAMIDYMEAEYERKGDSDIWRVEWEAEYVEGGKRNLFPHFKKERHMVPHKELMNRIAADKHQLIWWQGFDPGYATCFATLMVGYNPYNREVYFLDGIYETRRNRNSAHELWPRISAQAEDLYPDARWSRVYDSAALHFPTEVRAQFGQDLAFIPTYKEKDDEEKYTRLINTAFALDRAYISDRCGRFVWEIENYIVDENGNYPKKDDHAIDVARYILKMLNWNPVEMPLPKPELIPHPHMHGQHITVDQQEVDLMNLVENFNVFDF